MTAIKRVTKAVFPVAGLGTRFLPATKANPKEMLPVVDKPLIQYAVEEAVAAGITELVFINGRNKRAIPDHFDTAYELETTLEKSGKHEMLEMVRNIVPSNVTCIYIRQAAPLGLGHAVLCAKPVVGNEPFAVILPDDMVLAPRSCLAQMADAYETAAGCMVAVENVPREHTKRYGVLDPGKEDGALVEVKGLVEKPDPSVAPSTLSIIGRYILQPEIFDILEAGERGAGGEIQLTDAMAKLIGRTPFHGYRFAGTRYDCGDKLGFLTANIAYALERPEFADGLRTYLRGLSDK